MRVAYICSEYPAISHSFVQREVLALRELGEEIETFTIRRTPPEKLLSELDVAEDRRTCAILPTGAGRLIGAHVRALARSPRRYASTLAAALTLGPAGARNRLWQLFYFAEAMIFRRELRHRRVDHVHVHFVNVAAWVTLLACLYERDRWTWSFTMHGPLEFDDVDFYKIPEKVSQAAFVACISDFARSQLMRLCAREDWAKLHVVHCGVTDVASSPHGSPSAGTLQVASVGRLAPQKGFDVLLDALAEVRRDGVDARLTLVGDGPLRERLQQRAARPDLDGSVSFTGALSGEAVGAVLRDCDVFCLPSFAEGVPVVLMEAMASGLPVVTTRIMGIPELVEDGVEGLLVAPGRADLVAGALRRLAADPAERRRMGAAGMDKVRREYLVIDQARLLREQFLHALKN
jgi:glycosyltransferase involved in cell wall biosynthesis